MTVRDPFQADMAKSRALLHALSSEMAKSTAAQRRTQSRQAQWRKKESSGQNETMSGVMFENMMMGMLAQMFFGLPIFDGLGMADETARALGMMGTAAHHENSASKEPRQEKVFSDMMMAVEEMQLADAETAQETHARELAEIKKMLMAMMGLMLMQQNERKREDVAPDALRDPSFARFKQNRHSLDCIRSQFTQHVRMTAPGLRCA